jgi:hypothetical protein
MKLQVLSVAALVSLASALSGFDKRDSPLDVSLELTGNQEHRLRGFEALQDRYLP